MKILVAYLALLVSTLCSVIAEGTFDSRNGNPNENETRLAPLENRSGWVNPEDLRSMPQCIAQQDQSRWLATMTDCTRKQCTRHFGVICTHHQWETQLSCLSTAFSSDVIAGYLSYCSRSILTKAQLYRWVYDITGRTWLVEAGDANDVQYLPPSSFFQAFTAVGIKYYAPTCLTESSSSVASESFQQIFASCTFRKTTHHTGRADRPWEYREDLHSIVALDFEAVGYDLILSSVGHGEYVDKRCFCTAFTIDPANKSCSEAGDLDWTAEQLWINATCGPKSLSRDWQDSLKILGFAYTPIEDWPWPARIQDFPKDISRAAYECSTQACGIKSSGYCEISRAIDRACYCRRISYESCGELCQSFETRIDYVNWLQHVCGDLQDWHGFPGDWRHLAAPTAVDMIPWQWTIKPSVNSIPQRGPFNAAEECTSNSGKLGSFALVHAVTILAALCLPRLGLRRNHAVSWILKGMVIAGSQLLANAINAILIQQTPGYEGAPIVDLVLLWCSVPRITWVILVLIGFKSLNEVNFDTIRSVLFSEIVLQGLSLYYMIITIDYGRAHNFYFKSLEGAERGQSAKTMYLSALAWLTIMIMSLFWFVQTLRRMNHRRTPSDADYVTNGMNRLYEELGNEWEQYRSASCSAQQETSPLVGENNSKPNYGTLPIPNPGNDQVIGTMYTALTVNLFLVWVTQWLFWAGFIGLSSDEFCLPELGLLTTIWTMGALASTAITALE